MTLIDNSKFKPSILNRIKYNFMSESKLRSKLIEKDIISLYVAKHLHKKTLVSIALRELR